MNNEPLFSVIVPVYNTAADLDACVKSLLAQTYSQFEVILVDDASSDGSGALCDALARADARIRVIHQAKNCGVSAARNAALAQCKGDLVAFIDSDDYVDAHMLEKCAAPALEHDLVGFRFYYEYVEEGKTLALGDCKWEACATHEEVQRRNYPRMLGLTDKDVIRWINGGRLSAHRAMGMACMFVYRAEIIRKNALKFCESLFFKEDEIFVSSYLLHTNSMVILDQPFYYYCQRKRSAVHNVNQDIQRKIDNKQALLEEKNKLRDWIWQNEQREVLPYYAGSNLLSVMEMAFLCAKVKGGMRAYNRYLKAASVSSCAKLVPFQPKNLKFTLPLLMLKLRMPHLLYAIIKLVTLTGIDLYSATKDA